MPRVRAVSIRSGPVFDRQPLAPALPIFLSETLALSLRSNCASYCLRFVPTAGHYSRALFRFKRQGTTVGGCYSGVVRCRVGVQAYLGIGGSSAISSIANLSDRSDVEAKWLFWHSGGGMVCACRLD